MSLLKLIKLILRCDALLYFWYQMSLFILMLSAVTGVDELIGHRGAAPSGKRMHWYVGLEVATIWGSGVVIVTFVYFFNGWDVLWKHIGIWMKVHGSGGVVFVWVHICGLPWSCDLWVMVRAKLICMSRGYTSIELSLINYQLIIIILLIISCDN